MYFTSIALLLLVLPVVSAAIDAGTSQHALSLPLLTGKWFVFWAAGVRLFLAGLRQVIQPQFTALEIFAIHDSASWAIVRELGFANLSMGALGICSLFSPGWTVPAGLAGGLYYGLAGAGHVFQKYKNAKEYVAMISDWLAFVVLLIFVVSSLA